MRSTPEVDGHEAGREGRAAEEVTGGVRKEHAFGAERIRGHAEPRVISLQKNAMAGSETRKTCAGDARESGFRFTNRRRPGSQDPVELVGTDRRCDVRCVDRLFDLTVEKVWDGAVPKMTTDGRREAAGESLFLGARAGWKRDDVFRRMMESRGAGEKLRTKHFRVRNNGKHARLLVHMVHRGHPVATRDQPKSGILNRLQFPFDDAGADHGPPDAGGVVVDGTDVHFERVEK